MKSDRKARKAILVVENDREMLDGIVTVLESEGFSVSSAPSAAQAMKSMGVKLYDLVVADTSIEGELSCLDLVQITKSILSVPIIIMSDKQFITEGFRAIRHGADDYIVKPVDLEALREKVLRALSEGPGPGSTLLEDALISFSFNSPDRLPHIQSVVGNVLAMYGIEQVRLTKSAMRVIREGAMNALSHGRNKESEEITVAVAIRELGIVVTVSDAGNGFDWEKRLSAVDEGVSTRGLLVLRALADDLSFNEKGNELTVKLYC